MDNDQDLLRQYVQGGSQAAFAALVARHTDLVWSSALRLAGGDPHMAEDVAQVVFAALAVKAPRLKPGVVLPGWLLNATRYAAADLLKAERRRKRHERKAAMKHEDPGRSRVDPAQGELQDREQTWARVAPVLDDGLSQLSDSLRLAVVLRFFERRSMREVAARLGISEAAARQRVCRGLEQLRDALGRKSVAVPVAALAPLLAGHAVQAAPTGVASTLASGACLASAASAHGLAGSGSALWLLGGWAKGSAVAAVLVALLGSVGALVAWELMGQPPEETVILARPAPSAHAAGTADVLLNQSTLLDMAPASGDSHTPDPVPKFHPFTSLRLSGRGGDVYMAMPPALLPSSGGPGQGDQKPTTASER